jgi:hypothetical protein
MKIHFVHNIVEVLTICENGFSIYLQNALRQSYEYTCKYSDDLSRRVQLYKGR